MCLFHIGIISNSSPFYFTKNCFHFEFLFDFFRHSIIKFVEWIYLVSLSIDFLGYGHSTPNTISGKLFTMFYAIVGIPLGLVMFQSIGERLNKFSSVVIRNVKKLLNCKDVQVKLYRFYIYPLK